MKRGVRDVSARRLLVYGCVVLVGAALVALSGCVLFNRFPLAGFTIGPGTTGPVPFTVTLSGAPSSDPDGDDQIDEYSWDFGDGAQGNGKSVSHTYGAVGTYVITLTVTDKWGATDRASKTVYVTAAEPAGPTASFTASPTSGTSPLTVTFDAGASTYPGGTILSYEWSFGDGGTWTGRTATHTYFSAGNQTFTVTLTVRGTDAKSTTATKSITVTVPGGGGGTPAANAPSARFTIDFPDTAHTVAPVRVDLDPGDSEAAFGRTLQSYHWSYGDGLADTTLSPTVQRHYYTTDQSSKVFSVTLIVVDDNSKNDSITKTIKVENYQPVAGFEVSSRDNVFAGTQPVGDANWWTDDDDGLDDGRVTYSCLGPAAPRTVWLRSRQIVDADWQRSTATPVPNAKNAKPDEYDTSDGPNMCFDPEGQTWDAGTPAWFTSRSWGIERLSVNWGDGTSTPNVAFQDAADTTVSHVYNFIGGVQSWTITVTAYDYLGADTSFQRTITMNEGGCL